MSTSGGYRFDFNKANDAKQSVHIINDYFKDFSEGWTSDYENGICVCSNDWDNPIDISCFEGSILEISKRISEQYPKIRFEGLGKISDTNTGYSVLEKTNYKNGELQYISVSGESNQEITCPECGEYLIYIDEINPCECICCENCGFECNPKDLEGFTDFLVEEKTFHFNNAVKKTKVPGRAKTKKKKLHKFEESTNISIALANDEEILFMDDTIDDHLFPGDTIITVSPKELGMAKSKDEFTELILNGVKKIDSDGNTIDLLNPNQVEIRKSKNFPDSMHICDNDIFISAIRKYVPTLDIITSISMDTEITDMNTGEEYIESYKYTVDSGEYIGKVKLPDSTVCNFKSKFSFRDKDQCLIKQVDEIEDEDE